MNRERRSRQHSGRDDRVGIGIVGHAEQAQTSVPTQSFHSTCYSGLVFGYVLLCPGGCYRERPAQRERLVLKIMGKLKILYGEGDAEVLAAQAVSIQKAGHQVETAVGRKGVDEAVRKGAFDLVILGPTLTKNDRHHLPYIVKKVQPTRVLVMHTDGERHPAVDANIDTGRGMADVIAKINLMIANTEAAPGKTKSAAAGRS
jgi:hypothetical protein